MLEVFILSSPLVKIEGGDVSAGNTKKKIHVPMNRLQPINLLGSRALGPPKSCWIASWKRKQSDAEDHVIMDSDERKVFIIFVPRHAATMES